MGVNEVLEEIRARHNVLISGPEAEGVTAFYSAATLDVGTLLGLVDTMLTDGVREVHQAEILALQGQVTALTEQLAEEGQAHTRLKRRYRRLRDSLDAIPPEGEEAASGGAPGGGGQ